MVRVSSALVPMDSWLCTIKPDAMTLGYPHHSCHLIHMFGFHVLAQGTFKLTRVRAEQFCRAHAKMPYFETLIRFMIRGFLVLILKCKLRWGTPGLEAVRQRGLAHWLHDHNPRLPFVCFCVEEHFHKLKEEPVVEFPFY